MTVTSTYDHRVIQGAESGAFLAHGGPPAPGRPGLLRAHRREPAVSAQAEYQLARPTPAAQPGQESAGPVAPEMLYHVAAAMALVKAFRMHGHLAAHLDPLGTPPIGDPALDPGPARPHARGDGGDSVEGAPHRGARPDAGRVAALPPGHLLRHHGLRDRAHLDPRGARLAPRRRSRAAPTASRWRRTSSAGCSQRLTEVEALEKFLHKAYLGQKRFSIEGVDMLVPMLDLTIERAAESGARDVVIGMAHRGRLNVLAHTVGPAVRDDLRGVRGRPARRGRAAHARGRHRRREVPPRRRGRLPDRQEQGDHRHPVAQPQPSRVRGAGGGRPGPGQADPAPRAATRITTPPRRCRSPSTATRPSRARAWWPRRSTWARSRDTAPAARSTSSPTTRSASPPTWRTRARPATPSDLAKGFDIPIIHVNARRRRGLPQRGAAGDGVPRPVPPGRADRPGRLPAPRPQRGRRAGVHPAGDVRADQGAAHRRASCTPARWWRRACSPRKRRTARRPRPTSGWWTSSRASRPA